MRRRAVLRALGVGASGALAGCNAAIRGTSLGSTTPAATPTGTATDDAGPYRATGAPELGRPRGIHVRNLSPTDRFLTVVLADGDEEVFVGSAEVAAGDSTSFPDLLASGGSYRVLVETDDGARRRYDWVPREPFDDLWVELTPAITFRQLVVCTPGCPLLSSDEPLSHSIPTDLTAIDALRQTRALVLDNGAGRRRRVSVRLRNREALQFDASYVLPADVRVVVPDFPPGSRYRLRVDTDTGGVAYEWYPGYRNPLYLSLVDQPRVVCGFLDHDLRLRNRTTADRTLSVAVRTGEASLFEGSFDVEAGTTRTVPAAIAPVGPLGFRVETDDGRSEQVLWRSCATNGPIIVALTDQGIFISIRPSSEMG